jgi:hypothetical protein
MLISRRNGVNVAVDAENRLRKVAKFRPDRRPLLYDPILWRMARHPPRTARNYVIESTLVTAGAPE